ncbi:MAG TPA: branched-chain amino acid ABC transporter permease [Xanthobacteraceae bacterium]|nr:branched-chain amino acid ABC transporter permease [Xanthobacteraceae bacterium]
MTVLGFGIGRIRWNWLAALVVLLAALPLVSETNTPTLLAIWALFALSLALMWGYAGIISFGHAAYFGLGAYTYAIASFNIGESTAPVLLALAVPALVAAVIGAMMFYGRISDVYLGVMTLLVTLILNRFMNATAGDAYRIGNARLGGFNGIPAFPTLNVPGEPDIEIYGTAYYYVVIVCLLAAYLIARWILTSAFGRALIGIRENEQRMELLGYDVAAYKTAIFAMGGAMAGLAGCLFANWAEIVTPSVFSLGQTAEVLIWVIVGGLGTLVGPMLAAVVLGSLKLALGHQTVIDNSLVLGAILILVVLLIPRGFAPSFVVWRRRFAQSQVHRRQARGTRRRHVALQETKQ